MKPFNLEEALNGKPVITRDGLKVKELYLFKNRKSRYCLACLIEDDDIETFTKEGEYFKGKTNILDLFMAEEEFCGFKEGEDCYLTELERRRKDDWLYDLMEPVFITISLLVMSASVYVIPEFIKNGTFVSYMAMLCLVAINIVAAFIDVKIIMKTFI